MAYKIYMTAKEGSYIAAEEIPAKGGKTIVVSHPAFVGINPQQTGWVFQPLLFVEGNMELFKEGLLGRAEMPEKMVPDYEAFVQSLLPSK